MDIFVCDQIKTNNLSEGKFSWLRSQLIKDDCSFCNQFVTHTVENYWSRLGRKYGYESDIVFETEHTSLVAGLGALSEGYVLLVPKPHFLSVASLPITFHTDLDILKLQVKTALQSLYKSPVFFEHGCAIGNKRGGACVDHVHIHAFPCEVDLRPALKENFPETEIDTLSDIQSVIGVNSPYFFYENQYGEMFVYHVPEKVPSQYMRRVWAKAIGKQDEWDWSIYLNVENVARTIKALKGWFSGS